MSKVKSPTAWSFSRYGEYKLCPAKFKYKNIDKLDEPPNPAMARGTAIHKIAEQYVQGGLPAKMPEELKNFAPEFKAMRTQFKKQSLPILTEDQWAFTEEWKETQWNNWAECWVRIKLDCARYVDGDTIHVIDYKTGKASPYSLADYKEQLELYALAALIKTTNMDAVAEPKIYYLDSGQVFPDDFGDDLGDFQTSYSQKDVPALKKLWAKRVKAMMSDTRFAPRPNDKCKWCHFRASNGGPCKY